MFLEVVSTIFVIILVKACYAVEWMSRHKCSYSKPGHLFVVKKWIFLLALFAHKFYQQSKSAIRKALGYSQPRKHNEDVRPLTQHADAADVLYFNGFAESGEDVVDDTVLALQLVMRPDGTAELCLYLQVPGHGFLQHPAHPDTIVCNPGANNGDDQTFTADGVVIEVKDPDRRWRISYHGMMRMVDTLKEPNQWSNGKNLVYVKFGFTWTAYSASYNFTSEIDAHLLSESAAREFWSLNFFRKLRTFHRNHKYNEQWGQLKGTLYVDGMEEGQVGRELTLRGVRSHATGPHNYNTYHRYMRIGAHLKNGFTLSVTVACINDILTHVICGYVIQPDRQLYPITWCDLSLPRHGEDGRIPGIVQFNVSAEKHKCNVVCIIKLTPEVNNGLEWEGQTHQCLADIFINSLPGRGIVEFYYKTPGTVCPVERVKQTSPFTTRFPPSDSSKLSFSFKEPSCQNKQFVGEAGSQLACLKTLTRNRRMSECYIMEGFCLTTLAFHLHVKENKNLKEALDTMAVVLRDGSNEDLRDICNRCYAQLVNSTLSGDVTSEVTERFRKLANVSRRGCMRVEVRSSLCGEIPHSDESQTTVYRDLTGVNQILKAILKCWANQCGYEAVLYRRQNGLEAVHPMAVIIQAMVDDARSHGVITTCEVSSGDPTLLFINANYVVKKVTTVDQSQPDRMVLRQSDDGSFRIVSQSIGLKQKITKKDAPGVTTSNVAVEYVQECCLSYDNVLRLGQLALDIKNMFRDDREIAWTTSPGKIYLSGASRMSNDPTSSEFEDLHEFDTSYAMDDTWTTSAHIDGTFPEVATPLTLTTVVKATAQGLQDAETRSTAGENHSGVVASTACGRSLINIHDLMSPAEAAGTFDVDLDERLSSAQDDDDLEKYHGPTSSLMRRLVRKIVFAWNVLRTSKPLLESLTAENRHLVAENPTPTAADLFRVIDDRLLPTLRDVTRCHVTYCRKFDVLRGMTRTLLTGRRKPDRSVTTSLDMATICASRWDDVIGVIPDSLQRLSETIVDAGCREEFVALKPLKAVDWLLSDECVKARALYKELLGEFGHRCISELELREQSWSQDQTKIVTALQAIVENHTESKPLPSFDVDIVLEKLKTPLNNVQRFLLRLIIPWMRGAVREREWSNSMKMRSVERLKVAYWKLAKTLKSQCLLPDEDLTFFLTHSEIKRLIQCPSITSKFVPKAIKRRHVHARQKNLSFPVVSEQAPPEPLTNLHSSSDNIPYNTVLQGTPVCPGKVRAPVRIISDLSEAFLIQNGEILIVERPDIGWCAYYPLLKGLVTQVGQLSSHGSVLAANYSLPCVINVKHALNCFKTGEVVLLDGANGTIQRASGPDPTIDDTTMLHA